MRRKGACGEKRSAFENKDSKLQYVNVDSDSRVHHVGSKGVVVARGSGRVLSRRRGVTERRLVAPREGGGAPMKREKR